MDSNKLQNWLAVAGNVGLLAGLVLVALQLKQTNDLQKQTNELQQIEHISRSYELDMALVLASAGEDPALVIALAVFNPDEMTHRDQVAYSASLQYLRMIAERNAWLESKGLFDENWRNVTLPRIAFMLGGNPVARQWWDGARLQLSERPDWYVDLDMMIEQMDENDHLGGWGSIGQVKPKAENDATQ